MSRMGRQLPACLLLLLLHRSLSDNDALEQVSVVPDLLCKKQVSSALD
jgi:hypothetical protein